MILGTSDAWSMSHSSQRPSDPAYYIEDCRIYDLSGANAKLTYFSNKKKYVFGRRKCGHNNNSRPHTRKVSFISHLVAFMYLESTENCAYGPLFKNCYCLDV